VHDPDGTFHQNLNGEMVDLDPVDDEDLDWLREVVQRHAAETGSVVATRMLARWYEESRHFRKVFPKDYKRVLAAIVQAEELGQDVDEAVMAAVTG
jgi:glutamate synthase (NADPH/NADH) large chain